jgi:hypothetical protein
MVAEQLTPLCGRFGKPRGFYLMSISEGVKGMTGLDWIVTVIKIFLIAGFSYFSGNHLFGLLLYVLLVALPLVLMRWSSEFSGSKVGFVCLSVVGSDLLFHPDSAREGLVIWRTAVKLH